MTSTTPRTRMADVAAGTIMAAAVATLLCYMLAAFFAERAIRAPLDATLFATQEQHRFGKRVTGDPARLTDRLGLTANPLSQSVVNDLVVAQTRDARSFAAVDGKAALIAKLGWRYTPAVQNRLWYAARRRDIGAILDAVDALLRRSAIVDQTYRAANLMMRDSKMRANFATRLLRKPPWRFYYLQSANALTDPREILARAQLLQMMQAHGDKLQRNEIAPLLPPLMRIHRAALAAAIWRSHVGQMTAPLADRNFALATHQPGASDLPIIFEWQLGSGPGYYVDAQHDTTGPYVAINWDGRGTPGLLSQQTTARRARLRLRMIGDGDMRGFRRSIGARLNCPTGSVEFDPKAVNYRVYTMVAPQPAPCEDPGLELFGIVRDDHAPVNLVLRQLILDVRG